MERHLRTSTVARWSLSHDRARHRASNVHPKSILLARWEVARSPGVITLDQKYILVLVRRLNAAGPLFRKGRVKRPVFRGS
jgi:hypothetical protein